MNRSRTLSIGALMRACPAVALALAAACADSPSVPVQPVPAGETPASAVRLECTADVATRTVRCDAPGAAAGGPRADRIYGQGTGMKVTSSNIAIVADSFTFDMTVTNNLEYPVGTTDGVNPDPNGIRVFFVDGIHTTAGTGTVTVANADGVDVFTAAGQAYFAYPGVLQPAATTAPKKWKLRFDPGVEQFSFGLYISTPVPPGGGTVQLTILEPAADSTFTDSVVVRARIDSSPASLQSVKAFVADRSVVLAPYAPGLVRGTLPLTGLAFGSYPIRVHAVTVRADTGNAYVTIRKDAPPTLTVAAPVRETVARTTVRIDADCVDDDPAGCASVVASIGGVQLASGTTGIHTDVSLAAYNETRVVIQIDAFDSGGHKTSAAAVPVYVQSAPALLFADSAGIRAMDVDSARLLFSDDANEVRLRDRGTGTRTLLQPNSAGMGVPTGYLFPLGAIFVREGNQRLYEWRGGTVAEVAFSAFSLVVKGSWAGWAVASQPGVARRDLATGTSEGVGSGTPVDVGPNGDLVFSDAVGVKLYRTFPTTTLVDSGGSSPVTDGIHIAYLKAGKVTVWDGATRTVLSNTLTGAAPHTYYEVAGGWVAYLMVDGGGATQVRTRAPGGTDRQATTFGTSSQIRALSTEGTVVFSNGGSLYVLRAPYTGVPTRVARDWFRSVRFRGTELQLYLGNTVFTATY